MNLIRKLLASVVSHFVGYRVAVLWDGVYKVHQAKSVAEGIEWMAMYPNNSIVRVRRNLTWELVAERVS